MAFPVVTFLRTIRPMQIWTFFWVGSFILVITTMIRNEYMMYLIVGRVMKGSRPPEPSS